MRNQWVSGSVIAVLMVLVTVPGAMEWGTRPAHEAVASGTDRVVATDIGQQKDVRLASGARVILNTRTAVATRELPDHVQLDLRSGEVLVSSMGTRAKPLRVVAGATTVEATRAKFSIHRTAEDECVVRVFGGEVRILPNLSFMSLRLQGGRFARIARRKILVDDMPPETAARLLSWTSGKLTFDGDSLADVVAELNRYNREQILMADESLMHFRIGGSCRATNPMGFARALEATFGIRAVSVRSGGKGASVIVLTKRPGATPPAWGS